MKILLTGGSGMVGRNILEHPAHAKHQILAPSSVELNLLDGAAVDSFIAKHQPELVIHSAGIVGGIQANMANPVRFFAANMQMALNVINGSQTNGIKRLLNLGSSCMYPRNAPNPLREEMILTGELEPTNEGYALAKISAARLCSYIQQEDSSYHYKTLVPCNLYGRHDKFGVHNAHMIPAVIAKVHAAVQADADEIDIWGDGKARREFMYAGDLADFIYASFDLFDQLPDCLNIGIGHDYCINEYYATIAEALGYKGRFVHDLSKPVGMQQKLVDIQRLDTFGWSAKTSLIDGIKQTYHFFLEGQQ